MSNTNFIVLIILYTIFFIVTFFLLVKKVLKTKSIELSDFFKLFYIFFYGLVPICALIAIREGKESTIKCYFIENKADYIKYILYFLTVTFYVLYNIAFKLLEKKKIKFNLNKIKPINENSKEFYVANFVLLIVGWISLLIYTYDYGGIFATFKYAEDIRNNACLIVNRFTYFQPFTMILAFLPFNYLVLLSKIKDKNKKYKIITSLLSTFSIFGCVLVLIIIDSRSRMLMTILIIVYYFYKNKILNFNKKNFIKFAIIILLFVVLLVNSENISGILHNQERTKQQTKINEFAAQEFGYTYLNGINVLDRKVKGTNGNIRFFHNILSISVSLFPRSIQRKIVTNMPVYNTKFYHRSRGTVPSDLITSSVYSLGYVGPFVFPFWLALLTYCLNLVIKNGKNNNYYRMLEAYFGFHVCMALISNYDISAIIFSCFEFILWIIVVRLLSMKYFKTIVKNTYDLIS